jgi:hypothetical protein
VTLPLPVVRPHEDCEISAAAYLEADVLSEQVHVEDAGDTRRFLAMLLCSLDHERERYTAAAARHDYQAMAESAAEQRDVTVLAGVCSDHLRVHARP